MRFRPCSRVRQGMFVLALCSLTTAWGQDIRTKAPPVPPRQPPPLAKPAAPTPVPAETISIPGPLRSFLRLAGVSQQAESADVLPLLARNVYLDGYTATTPTEFLLLIRRYVSQARELEKLAGPAQTIRVENCEGAGTLLRVLGFRLAHGCGREASLETAEPDRAFLTIDSGFPLVDLEEALQRGTPFTYAYTSTPVPVIFRAADWMSLRQRAGPLAGDQLDLVLGDPAVARLYWGLSKMEAQTRLALQNTIDLRALLAFGPLLDFYGSQLYIKDGRVQVPGGSAAEPAWAALVGASPDAPPKFVANLLSREGGWLAAYFDVLSRLDPGEQAHLTGSARLKANYEAFRLGDDRGSATYGLLRPASELLVLDTRLWWEANGEAHVPGGLEPWKEILRQWPDTKLIRGLPRRAASMDRPDQLVEALTSLSRVQTETGPLQLYLTLSELDRRRPADRRLSPDAVKYLAANFAEFRDWMLIFTDFPQLTDESMHRFIEVAQSLGNVRGDSLRTNAIGALQANVGLWQILARQGELKDGDLNRSWTDLIEPFAKVTSAPQLFDATRSSLRGLLTAAGSAPESSPSVIVSLLAGPPPATPESQRVRSGLAARMQLVLDDQRLVSLDTLFGLSDGLADMARTGAKGSDDLLSMAGDLHGFELPRAIFTSSEKVSFAPNVYRNHHVELQVQTDLAKVIKSGGTRAQLETERGNLMPFLRDALVGLNYAYYEPPGAEILHINSLFVRAHDFLGVSVIGANRTWRTPVLLGAGVSAGGGAYLMGSLADLPYALAQAEQDFIVPENVQALVWKELVPGLIAGATLPRWWGVSPDELHAAALYQRSGEEILRGASADTAVRGRVLVILGNRLPPRSLEAVEQALPREQDVAALLPKLMPSVTFFLGEEYGRRFPEDAARESAAARELAALAARSPDAVDPERLAATFGVPHPTLARTNARELLDVQPFPFSSGYTSRLFGESLQSNNLYWARLADEMGYAPATLNRLVPELTRHMAGKIFATNIEDWPAVLRALEETREDLRAGKIFPLGKAASGQAANATGSNGGATATSGGMEKPTP